MSTNPDVVIQQVFDQIEKLGDRQIEQTEKLANIQGFMSAITSMQNDISSNRASTVALDRRVTALEHDAAVVWS